MKRYSKINVLEGAPIIDYSLSEYDKGAYVVDRSHFTPVSELAKSVVGQSIGKTDLARYDFADGKDNGMSVPVARRRPELAEMSVDVRRQQKSVKDKIDRARKVQEFKQLAMGSASDSFQGE